MKEEEEREEEEGEEEEGGEGGGVRSGTGGVTQGEVQVGGPGGWPQAANSAHLAGLPLLSLNQSLHGVLTHFSNKTALSFHSLPGDS